MYNTHCFSTATIVALSRLNITLYLHYLPCLVLVEPTNVKTHYKSSIQRDSKRWTQRACTSCRQYGLNSKRRLNTRQTVGCGIPSSLLALRVDLRGLRSKLSLNSSHVLLWYTWSAGASAFTQTAYLLKAVILTTDVLPRWRMNVETKTKRTLHSSRRLSFNELTNAKNLVLHSSHFALNWSCCTAVR